MFIALSVVGGMIKIPAIIGSVALDLSPALIAAILLGPIKGGVVAFLGHLASSFVAGFPLGAFHFLIALEMFVIVWGFGLLYDRLHNFLSFSFVVILNSIVAPLPFYFLMGKAFYVSIIPSLFIGSVINGLVAILVSSKLFNMITKLKGET